MSTETLRKDIDETIQVEGKFPKEQFFTVDENFWRTVLSLYRLRLHEHLGINALRAIVSIGQVIKEQRIPDAEKIVPVIHQLIHEETDTFALMKENPWNIDPFSPPEEEEKQFINNLNRMHGGDYQKKKKLVHDYLSLPNKNK